VVHAIANRLPDERYLPELRFGRFNIWFAACIAPCHWCEIAKSWAEETALLWDLFDFYYMVKAGEKRIS
jgi:hypothetical protein